MTTQTEPIAPKNYFAYITLVLITIFITLYSSSAYLGAKAEKDNMSVLEGTISELEIDEVETFLLETENAVIFITNSSDENIKLEATKLLNVINTYDLANEMVYINVASDVDYKNKLEGILPSVDVPNILVYQNNSFISSLDGKDGYSSVGIVSYLSDQGIIEVDAEIEVYD